MSIIDQLRPPITFSPVKIVPGSGIDLSIYPIATGDQKQNARTLTDGSAFVPAGASAYIYATNRNQNTTAALLVYDSRGKKDGANYQRIDQENSLPHNIGPESAPTEIIDHVGHLMLTLIYFPPGAYKNIPPFI